MLFTRKSFDGRLGGALALATGVSLLVVGALPGRGAAGTAAATVLPHRATADATVPLYRATADTTVPPYRAAAPVWAACRNLPPAPPGVPRPRVQCAELTVPLDYSRPRGRTIRLALIRVRATDPAHRIGSLVFNFGGPGASGVDPFASGAGAQFEKLGTRYDLVGLDPRGVGRSSPVTCADDAQKGSWLPMDDSPDDAAERAALVAAVQSFNRGCAVRSGAILPYVGTVEAARDLDVLRAALGDRKLNYLGFSYGTWLGAAYAHLFPGHVGRMVLDGAFDTSLTPEQVFRQQAAGFQRALGHFSRWAARQPAAKRQGPGRGSAAARVAALLHGLDAKPLPTDTGRTLTQSLGEAGVLAALYSEQSWPLLLQAVGLAETGDGSILLALSDAFFQRGPDGHFTNYHDASIAIYCASTTERYTERDIAKMLPSFTKASPVFGPGLAWRLLGCTGWPTGGDPAAHRVDAPGAPPIVVVGTTGDPATPYAWAPALARQLGTGVLVTFRGEGHGAYVSGDGCIRRTVDRYLLDGAVPARGTSCA